MTDIPNDPYVFGNFLTDIVDVLIQLRFESIIIPKNLIDSTLSMFILSILTWIPNWISNWSDRLPYPVTLKENFPGDHDPYHVVRSHRRLPRCQHGCPDGVVLSNRTSMRENVGCCPKVYLERYLYLKLKMCKLWARGLSMLFAILHINLKKKL